MDFSKKQFIETAKELSNKYAEASVGTRPEEALLAAIMFAAWCGALSTVENAVPPETVLEMQTYFGDRYRLILLEMLQQREAENMASEKPN